jgi:hypothetical protein
MKKKSKDKGQKGETDRGQSNIFYSQPVNTFPIKVDRRYCRTKVRELTKLGTFLHTAILVGLSRKGPWRLSRTLATQSGMTNQWLKVQGLLSIKDLWVNIHYPVTTR